jgi:hypothetical protein
MTEPTPVEDAEKIAARDPLHWPVEAVERIERVLARSRRSAGDAARETFDRADRQMSAVEFVQFWNGAKVKAMATVSPNDMPHIAPIHASFEHGDLKTTIYVNAVRRFDIRNNPEVALTTWGDGGAAASVYGRARELEGTEKATRNGASGAERRTVGLAIEVHRIYAMKSRAPE